ncbi:hypothetical protein [Flavobacterium sp. IB48]|uniref:hypothetical protein n=1 Tax=Flavobacterium sp. IB48 TaxID=2779375 RepID=UPI0018E712CD|nr:hypothetical protein [Flavobacterium sp. IB48]MBJ2126569.1 hypothetical protein [Flavobacterium sp. IB48]
MSQDISLLIFKEDNSEIPETIPHFINGGIVYMPICNPTGYLFGELITTALNKKQYDILDYKDEFSFVKLAHGLGVENYMAFHSSDFGMMPINYYEFAVVENVFMKDSVWSTDGIITSENICDFEDNYEKNRGDVLLEIKIDYNFRGFLRSYDDCKSVYEKWGNRVNFHDIQKSYYQQKNDAINNGVDDSGNKFFTGEIFKDGMTEVYYSKEGTGVMKTFWMLVKRKLGF